MRAMCITGHGAEGEGSAAAACNLLIVPLCKAFLYRTGKLLALHRLRCYTTPTKKLRRACGWHVASNAHFELMLGKRGGQTLAACCCCCCMLLHAAAAADAALAKFEADNQFLS